MLPDRNLLFDYGRKSGDGAALEQRETRLELYLFLKCAREKYDFLVFVHALKATRNMIARDRTAARESLTAKLGLKEHQRTLDVRFKL